MSDPKDEPIMLEVHDAIMGSSTEFVTEDEDKDES